MQTVPVICGLNSGQHSKWLLKFSKANVRTASSYCLLFKVYIDVGASTGDVATLNFAIAAASAGSMWDIKVTQVECSNANS